jgi:S-adenosylmethionine/arginine decarboxylase-like enzyme
MVAPVHHHLIIRAEVKKPMSDVEVTKTWLDELVTKIGMKKVSGPHVAYIEKEGNKGITGCVIIETSHIAFHVWDETNPALVQLDVYTCSCLPLEAVFEHLDVMQPRKIEYKFLDREHGLKFVK